MNKKSTCYLNFKCLSSAVFLVVFFLFSLSWGQNNFSQEDQAKVQKVLQIIERLEKEALVPQPRPWKEVVLTEEELNAYIAYRLKTDRVEMLQDLQIKLLDNNLIEGKAIFDLSGENLPDFVPRMAVVFFSTVFRVEGGRIHFDFKKIFLGPQEISVDFVSEMIKQIAIAHQATPQGLNRSYDLPFGIKDIKSRKGLAIFYY